MNESIVQTARAVAETVVANHQDVHGVYSFPVGNRILWVSGDASRIVGTDTIVVQEKTFFIGFRQEDEI